MNTVHLLRRPERPAERMPPGRAVVLEDDLTDGILHRDHRWNQTLRSAHLGHAVRDLDLLDAVAESMRSHDEVVIWTGPAHADQVMAAWAVSRLRSRELCRGRVRLATPLDRRDRPVRLEAAAGRDLARGYMLRAALDVAVESLLDRLWDAVTADSPEALQGLTPRELRPLPFWPATRDALLARFPDATGLGFHDRVLLMQCTRRWRSAARVVAETAAEAEYLAPISRRAAWQRLLRLAGGSSAAGALAIRCEGPLAPEQAEVRLTELGAAGAEGTTDVLARLPLCEWVGGVLLLAPDRIWRWTEAGLVRDPGLQVW